MRAGLRLGRIFYGAVLAKFVVLLRAHDGLHSPLNSVLVLGFDFDFGRRWHLHLALESVAGGADPVAAPVPVLVRRR